MIPHCSRIFVLCPALLAAPCLAQDLEVPVVNPVSEPANGPSDLPLPVEPSPSEYPDTPGALQAPAQPAVSAPDDLPPPPVDNVPSGYSEVPVNPEAQFETAHSDDLAEPSDLQAPVAGPPSGFSNPSNPFFSSPMGSGMEEAARRLHFGLASSLVYDSNFFQASFNEQDEVTFTISPTLSFRTEGAHFKVFAQAALDYNTYFDNSDFNGLGYQFTVGAEYTGGPLTVNASIDSSKDQGVNRYYGGAFVETLNFGAHLGASYRIGPKTSIDTRFGYSWSDPDRGGLSESENLSFDLSAMWQATPLLRIGPGISWTMQEGSNQADRETIGPMLRAQYKVGSRISLDGSVGLDFVDYQGAGGSDTDFSCSLGVAYRWSELWGMNLTLYHGTTADASAFGTATGSFRETTSVTLGYHRRIKRALWDVGLSYSMDDSSSPNGGLAPGSTDYFSFHTSLGMPVFANRANASIFYTWSQESGNALRDWSGHQIGFQISSSF